MPRKKKAKAEFPAAEPVTAGDAAAAVMEWIEQAREAKAQIEPERPDPGSFTAAIEASRPKFGPVPPGYSDVKTDAQAGIRVNKRLWRDQDGNERSTAALQFAENRKLSRDKESALVDRVEDADFRFRNFTRQWQRDNDPATQTPGENLIGALRLMDEVKQARGEGRGR